MAPYLSPGLLSHEPYNKARWKRCLRSAGCFLWEKNVDKGRVVIKGGRCLLVQQENLKAFRLLLALLILLFSKISSHCSLEISSLLLVVTCLFLLLPSLLKNKYIQSYTLFLSEFTCNPPQMSFCMAPAISKIKKYFRGFTVQLFASSKVEDLAFL